MKNFASRIIIVFLSAFVFACEDDQPPVNQGQETPYKKDELVVMYKVEASPDTRKLVEDLIREEYPNATKTVCSSCNNLVDLWEAPGIHNFVLDGHAEVTTVGSSRTSGHTDNGNIVFSPNFLNSFPQDADFGSPSSDSLKFSDGIFTSKQEVLIAILDSGVDLGLFPSQFLWNISNDNSSDNCYKDGKVGWNTINHDGNTHDDTEIKHGTFVNAYILEQFLLAKNNVPKLLNVKVLDKDNSGTLFSLLCGIFYARSKNANIINTSLGFYDYDLGGVKHPYLLYLINELLKKDNILLVTAAGNRTEDSELLFKTHGTGDPRKISDHHFYLAYLGETDENSNNNIFVATTVDTTMQKSSPRQNYSSAHVDVGVVADLEDEDSFYFGFPFTDSTPEGEIITGSSFAAAITTGKIGANVKPVFFGLISGGSKGDLSFMLESEGIFINPTGPTSLETQVYNGKYLKRRE